MDIYVGTSGYSYPPWKRSFYPQKLRNADMLAFYATRLNTVEINNSFYEMPDPEVVARWASEVPASFRFSMKIWQRITHHKKLAPEIYPDVNRFLEVRAALGDRMGPVLIQTAQHFKKDLNVVRAFLEHVNGRAPLAFELGHESLRDRETYALFREHNAAVVAIDDPKKATPLVTTGDIVYARCRLERYSNAQLEGFVQTLRATGAKSAWIYFKHEDTGTGPRLAKRLAKFAAATP